MILFLFIFLKYLILSINAGNFNLGGNYSLEELDSEFVDNIPKSLRPSEHPLYLEFMNHLFSSVEDHSHIQWTMNFFNRKISPKLVSKEAWLQAMAMKIVYMDLFHDLYPSHRKIWQVQNHVHCSVLNPNEAVKNQFASSYVLAENEYGSSLQKEYLGLRAQLWIPKSHESKAANLIVFQGTNLNPSQVSAKKNIGTGLWLNMDYEGLGKEAFSHFSPVFQKWIESTIKQQRKLVITGHSLGGALSLRLHSYAVTHYRSWALDNVDTTIFNSPGVDSNTAASLDQVDSISHIINAGIYENV
jgi:hypothetical protein